MDLNNIGLGVLSFGAILTGFIYGAWAKIKLLASTVAGLFWASCQLTSEQIATRFFLKLLDIARPSYGLPDVWESSYLLYDPPNLTSRPIEMDKIQADIFLLNWRLISAGNSSKGLLLWGPYGVPLYLKITAYPDSHFARDYGIRNLTLSYPRWLFSSQAILQAIETEMREDNAKKIASSRLDNPDRDTPDPRVYFIGSRKSRDLFSRNGAIAHDGSPAAQSVQGQTPATNELKLISGCCIDGNYGQRFISTLPERSIQDWTSATAYRNLGLKIYRSPLWWEIYHDCLFMVQHQSWFRDRNIPWRRSYLFCGEPGTGKTYMVREMGRQLSLPIYVVKLAECDNEGFREAMRDANNCRPRILLIDDFDRVFDRDKITCDVPMTGEALHFTTVLNELSGAADLEGYLLFVLVNDPSKLDPAICDWNFKPPRPRRIDRIFEFAPLEEEGKRHFVDLILSDWSAGEREEFLARYPEKQNLVPFVAKCQEAALRRLAEQHRTKFSRLPSLLEAPCLNEKSLLTSVPTGT